MLTVTDLFCGAGGSSTGAIQVPGVRVVIAANHWQLACDVHNLNHQDTDHAAVDLHQEQPSYFPRTDVLWASPECTKWSPASGSAPRPAIEEGLFEDPLSDEAANRSRLLMFDVLRFADHHRYRAMVVENVVDVATQSQYRLAWYEWRRQLAALGYRHRVVSLNSMHAQTFGPPAPQSRDRIYIVCWRAGERAPDLDRILRPAAYCSSCREVVRGTQSWKNGKTVGRYRQTYVYTHTVCGTVVEPGWLPAAAAIDWTIPGERVGDRLKPKTRARIAAGIARYWGPLTVEAAGNTYDAADPAHPRHGEADAYYRAWPTSDPLRALHTTNSKALVVPVEARDGKQARDADDPLRTLTTRAETALAQAPFVAEMYGTSTARTVAEPAGAFTAGGNHHALVTPAGGSWNKDARPDSDPLRTLTSRDAYGLAVAPFVLDRRGEYRVRAINDPMSTITANDTTKALISPYYGTATHAKPASDPLGTLTTVDRYALVTRHYSARGNPSHLTTPVSEEMRTLTATGGNMSLLQAGTRDGRPTVSPADLAAAEEMVPEVLFRMFRPHEVAAGMAFPPDYRWDALNAKGRTPSNRDLVKMAGNAVTPPSARDLLAAVAEAITGEPIALTEWGWAA